MQVTKDAGVAIIGQTGDLAPADKRVYATRDITATVDNISLDHRFNSCLRNWQQVLIR